MFFIGIFGIGPREEERPLQVPVEGCTSPVLIQRCQQFHFFFIPIFRWNREYLIRCGNRKVLALKQESGEQLWSGKKNDVTYWDYRVLMEQKTCAHCGQPLEPTHAYCPNCGTKT